MINKFSFFKFSTSKQRVTFIGLGNMGYSMASNLSKSGKFIISGFDINKSVQEEFNKQENTVADSFHSSVSKSDYIMTMLPNTEIVKNTINDIFNNNKHIKQVQFIDSSTICPIESKEISNFIMKNECFSCDAPVSGGVVGAKNASLTFMIGTPIERYEFIKSFLSFMGKNFFHCGNIGTGQIAKVCNNLVLGITTAGVSEAVCLGTKLGIDEKILAKIMSVSSANCWSLNVNSPIPGVLGTAASDRDYEKGFNSELMLKDMDLGMKAAERSNMKLELSKISLDYYKDIKEKNKGKKDFSIVYQYLKNNKKI